MISRIPIRNIYYLLCYAWNRLEEDEPVDVNTLDGADTVNLLAQLLVALTHNAVRRGLNRDYLTRHEELAGVRGRLLVAESSRKLLFNHGRAACAFDELDHNNLPNRILKASLETLHDAETITGENKIGIATVVRELNGIDAADLRPALFRRVRLHRSNSHYGMLLSICELAYDCLLPERGDGVHRFRNFVEDHALMAAIYEEFVRNFYSAHAPRYGYAKVSAPVINWVATSSDDPSADVLPRMETDIVLDGPRKIIIDCKFYHEALLTRFDQKRLNPGNLYQIYAYVKNQSVVPGWEDVEGLLLYPTVQADFAVGYDMGGNRVRAATVDLAQPWPQIRNRLLEHIAPAGDLRRAYH